jgi:fumarate hydratase subunit beta
MMGKGNRSSSVVDAIVKYGCVYFAATGGAGALLSKHITAAEVICYPELGPEAVFKLTVRDFPLITAIDSRGKNIYVEGPKTYKLDLSNANK